MKNLMVAALAALSFTATAAHAGDVSLEARFADPNKGSRDSTEYRVQYDNEAFGGKLNYGVELQTKQATGAGAIKSAVSAKLGTKFNAPLGLTVTPRVEVGRALTVGKDFQFWGAQVAASRNVYGPVSAEVGYRHRAAFDGARVLNENRLNAGLVVAVSDRTALGVTYYRTRGTSPQDAIGVGYRISF